MEGYKYLGYANGWPTENGEGSKITVTYPKELTECREKGHQMKGTSDRYGHHHYWCPECKIEYFMDSGD